MPGAYENRYDEGIQNALAGMDSANSAGLGYDSQNGTYRGALSRLFGNAGAGASAAEQVANSLSGGYGTDWAKSAAQQAAAGETGQTANVYAQARADALSQWQQELAGQGTQLNNLLTQDQLARSEYDGSQEELIRHLEKETKSLIFPKGDKYLVAIHEASMSRAMQLEELYLKPPSRERHQAR